MTNENEEIIASENDDTETNDSTNVEESAEDTQVDDVEALKEQNKKLFARAKKAEAELKTKTAPKETPKEQPKEQKDIASKDIIALITANVTQEEDIEEVTEYAKFKGISVAEALKSPIVKNVLKEKEDNRKASETMNVGTKRGTSKTSPSDYLEKAKEGKFIEDTDALAKARADKKKADREALKNR